MALNHVEVCKKDEEEEEEEEKYQHQPQKAEGSKMETNAHLLKQHVCCN